MHLSEVESVSLPKLPRTSLEFASWQRALNDDATPSLVKMAPCEQDEVTCIVRCGPHMHVWAIRIEQVWKGACSPVMSWELVASVASISIWDLTDLIVASSGSWWTYPQDLSGAADRCLRSHHDPPVRSAQASCTPMQPAPPPSPSQPIAAVLAGAVL